MLLERNQVVLGAVFGVLLLAGTVFAVAVSGGVLNRGVELTAEFEDAAGLQSGSSVFVAGVRIGQVLSVRRDVDEQLAVARFTVTEPDKIPADSGAAIILENTLGKRAIDLEAGTSDETLAAGDVIPNARTTTPIDLPRLNTETGELLTDTNVQALQDVIDSLAQVTEDKREDVQQLIDGVERVSRIVSERRQALQQVIRRAESVVDAAADKDRDIIRIVDSISTTLDTLAQRREDVTRLLEQTARSSNLTADLIEDRRTELDSILNELHQDLQIVDQHQVDLAITLAQLPVGVEGFASIGYGGGDDVRADTPEWGNVFTVNLGSVGLETIACNGPVDQVLTRLIGPDPGCSDERAPDSATDRDSGSPEPGPSPSPTPSDTGGDPLPGELAPSGDSPSAPTGGVGDFLGGLTGGQEDGR